MLIIENVVSPATFPHATVRRRSIGSETSGSAARDSTITNATSRTIPAVSVTITSTPPKPCWAAVDSA
ncbi:hypothetical protein GCM10010219_05710 [Streptomyces netropsis]|nr:hypothetical protein GCM10010219_05710 [Streptomyces netropsis]